MPSFKEISPSKESTKALSHPITVINRAIAMNSIIKKHRHNWGQFIYANQGVLTVTTTNARYIVPPEQGVWITPETNHEVTAISPVELTSFYFDNVLLKDLPQECCVLCVSDFLKNLIVEAKNIGKDYSWQETDGRLLRLIRDRISSAANVTFQLPSPRDPKLLSILNKLQSQPSNRNTLEQWGNILGASARSLSRSFKKETGLSYSEWRQRLYIQMAITLISKGESISNISLDLGYESSSAFIHMFKNKTGITPGLFLQQNLVP